VSASYSSIEIVKSFSAGGFVIPLK
jgi:hypothetical protein